MEKPITRLEEVVGSDWSVWYEVTLRDGVEVSRRPIGVLHDQWEPSAISSRYPMVCCVLTLLVVAVVLVPPIVVAWW